jgi:NAD(P)-dependent dehydrogenase (short-subunit alcohol dehydrogenase family)
MATSSTSGVVVTGGASGIGRACAQAVAEQGRSVAIWDLDPAKAEATAAEIASETGVATFGRGIDVTRTADFDAAIDATREAIGEIGGLVHAAGTVRAQSIGQLDEAGWDFVLNVNLRAFPLLVQALHADLKASPGASVVGIASIEAWVGNEAIPAYCASKAGMLGAVRSMSHRLAPDDIRVNAICPGFIETPMLAPSLAAPGVREEFSAASPMGRIGRPSEIGEPAAFLLGNAASFITGQSLIVDGGVLAIV